MNASPSNGSVNSVRLGWVAFFLAHALLGLGASQLVLGMIAAGDDAMALRGAVVLVAAAIFCVAAAVCAQRPSEAR